MKPRLLVISPPCHQPVNRAVYYELASRHGIPVRLVVPRQLSVGGVWRDTQLGDAAAAYELVLVDLKGTHGRLQRMATFDDATLAWAPTHIFVDSDPASLMTRQAITTFPKAKVWAMTAENLPPRYVEEFLSGLKALKPARMLAPLMVFALRTWIHPKVDRVFTLSQDGTRVMEKLGLRATQIPLGFDPALFCIQEAARRSATRARIGLKHPTVAYFGRQTPEKGVHLLVEALAGLKHLEWQFLIDHFAAYGGSYIEKLRALIEASGIADRVVYFDARHDEMPDYMNASDIVVLPSVSTPKWKEQYGRVIPEAMACGRAVIGSDSGAIPELIAGFGDIFPEGDVGALRGVLERLLQAPNLAQRGEKASIHAHQQLSITRQAEILASCLVS
jgi:glycosyltransferase involved in cell wall biosynthesis